MFVPSTCPSINSSGLSIRQKPIIATTATTIVTIAIVTISERSAFSSCRRLGVLLLSVAMACIFLCILFF